MWTITGPFDGDLGDLSFQKAKLLKTGKTYTLGRKDCDLVIANKKVSKEHGFVVVGPFGVDDLDDPTSKPTLKIVNKKDKGYVINRGEEQVFVNPHGEEDLEDGDTVAVLSGILISVQWVPVCCYASSVLGKSVVPLDACASLGIHVVHVPNSNVTHHLISTFSATPVIACSLISACQFVKPEWASEVIRLGMETSEGSLEDTFSLPPTNKYRPAFSPSLPPSQKEFRVWEPNPERYRMFRQYRFLWVDEKGRELIGDCKDMIDRGGGTYEKFDVRAGKAQFHRALTRGKAKEGQTLVIIGNQESIEAAIGNQGCNELKQEAQAFGLHFVNPSELVQAVIRADTSVFEQTADNPDDREEGHRSSSPIPDIIPNTHPDEPSLPVESEPRSQPTRKLVRRVASRQPSEEPKSQEPQPEAPRPRRVLTRRVHAGAPVVTGLDDPSAILDAAVTVPPRPASPPPMLVDLTTPTPVRPKRLKRRVGEAIPDLHSQLLSSETEGPSKEPPLKKFKALFDASHPDRNGAGSIEEIENYSQSQTQSEGRVSRTLRSAATTDLEVLREEEEEQTQWGLSARRVTSSSAANGDIGKDVYSGTQPPPPNQAANRPPPSGRVGSVPPSTAAAAKPASIRAGSRPPLSTKIRQTGAQPGEPDKDSAFLKAVASSKRGKRQEDEFDRDFNKLRISKPDLNRDEPEKEWAILDDFGDDTDIRGNFMVIVEMEVDDHPQRQTRNGSVAEWEGKPNFKKFKKKGINNSRAKIELVANEANDYGMGTAYWKGGNSQSQEQAPPSQMHQIMEEMPASMPKSQAMVIDDSDDDGIPVRSKSKKRPASREGPAAPAKRTRTTRAAKTQPLFIDSDEEPDDSFDNEYGGNLNDSDDDAATLRGGTNPRSKATTKKAKGRAATRSKKTAVNIVDDDSDDGAVFKGFQKKRGR